MSDNQTLKLFIKISQQRMYNHYLPKLIESVRQLNLEALWYKEIESLNSIGGIIIHICEHIKRNSIRFSNQKHISFNKGIEEHFPNLNLPPEELRKLVEETFNEFNLVMQKLVNNTPQEIDMHSLYHLVEHTGYHLGQIVDRSKRITGTAFNFCQNGINEKNLKALIEER